jgi:hypothetical protein
MLKGEDQRQLLMCRDAEDDVEERDQDMANGIANVVYAANQVEDVTTAAWKDRRPASWGYRPRWAAWASTLCRDHVHVMGYIAEIAGFLGIPFQERIATSSPRLSPGLSMKPKRNISVRNDR